MRINLPKINFSAHNIAVASFAVIAFTSWLGLGFSMKSKPENESLTPAQWVLVVTGSFSIIGGCCLDEGDSDNQTFEDDRGSRSGDVQVHTHFVLPASFDLVEQERQARCNLITKISDFGTGSNPLEVLQRAIQICSDTRLWLEPARAATAHIDTERFYRQGKIWPTIQGNGIMWSLNPDYDPPEETLEIEKTVEQTLFRPFNCCSQCQYIGKYHDCCAVVPFGCGTGDPSVQCREFESEDGGTPVPELTINDFPY